MAHVKIYKEPLIFKQPFKEVFHFKLLDGELGGNVK